jgi:single-stranded-DNA-specific exonuclease
MICNYQFEISNPDPVLTDKLAGELGISQLLAKLLVVRGFTNAADAELFLYGTLNNLHDSMEMGDLPKAVDIILEHINNNEKILVHGDYDADGITSTAIILKAFSQIGVDMEYYVPDRFDDGYGFAEDAVKKAVNTGVKLIITVDCGSSNPEIVKIAHDSGLKVIITDHHEVPEQGTGADAFINLKKPGETYSFRELSGAGVAFKLVQAIYKKLNRDDWTDFLDLAAVGTIADVVPLIDENRIIVKEGIKLLGKRKHVGIAKLLELTNVTRDELSPWDVSFIIAPKINAAGRIGDATKALKFLMEENPEEALRQAQELCSLNEQRQQLENVIKEDIENMINTSPEMLTQPVWVLGSRKWHQGVIGIVASRFCQNFKRPVFLISIDENGTGRGSSRCSENYSVYEALGTASDLLTHYGGHRLAGGFSIPEENIDKFRERVNNPELFKATNRFQVVDCVLSPEQINLATAEEVEALAPYGEGNPKPVFLTRQLKIQSLTLVGPRESHLKLWVSTGYGDVKAIAFGKGAIKDRILNKELYYDLIYNLDADTWNNTKETSMKIQNIIEPDRECYRIISGLEDAGICSPEEKPDENKLFNWSMVDARNIINRRNYIKKLYNNGKRSLILTRYRKHAEVLMENLRQEGVECITDITADCNGTAVTVLPYDSAREKTDVEEVILYHPPYLWNNFVPELFKSPDLRRVHFLINSSEIEKEEKNQETLSPDRETLLRIFVYLQKIAGTGELTRIEPAQIARSFKNPYVQTITIKIALKIFSEIDLVEVVENKGEVSVRINKQERRELEESPTFQKQSRKKTVFLELKELYTKPSLNELTCSISQVLQERQKEE